MQVRIRPHKRHRIGLVDFVIGAWLITATVVALLFGGCTFTSTPGGGVHLSVLPLKLESTPGPMPTQVSNPKQSGPAGTP